MAASARRPPPRARDRHAIGAAVRADDVALAAVARAADHGPALAGRPCPSECARCPPTGMRVRRMCLADGGSLFAHGHTYVAYPASEMIGARPARRRSVHRAIRLLERARKAPASNSGDRESGPPAPAQWAASRAGVAREGDRASLVLLEARRDEFRQAHGGEQARHRWGTRVACVVSTGNPIQRVARRRVRVVRQRVEEEIGQAMAREVRQAGRAVRTRGARRVDAAGLRFLAQIVRRPTDCPR